MNSPAPVIHQPCSNAQDPKQIALGIGKAICVCGKDVGPVDSGEALLKVRKGAKVKFANADGNAVTANAWMAIYTKAVA